MTPGTGYPGGTGTPGGPPPGAGAPRHPGGDDTRHDDELLAADTVGAASETDTRFFAGAGGGADIGGEAPVDGDAAVAALRRERDEYLDMVRRLQADFENYKKRIVRQQTDHLERAAVDVVTKVLPVLDAFDLARAHLGDGDDISDEGKALLAASGLLSDTLAREGLERIDDAGVAFDPTIHEAVEQVAAADPTGVGSLGADPVDEPDAASGDAGPVVDGVLRAGYRFKGRVIRPAMVRVRG